MKKFYKLVTTDEVPGGFTIGLDGRAVKTPAGAALVMPGRALAEAAAAEWTAQGEEIIPDTMPLTQLMTTCIDHVRVHRADLEDKVVAYLDTDLLCYRAESPADLAVRQQALWDPLLSWFAQRYGCALSHTTGLQALVQPPKAHEAVRSAVAAQGDEVFTVQQLVTQLAGSVVVALAFVAGEATPEAVYDAVNAEEDYKAEIYNEAEHGVAPTQQKRQDALRRDLFAARKLLDLCEI